jgi:S1-C subfamily serine protease
MPKTTRSILVGILLLLNAPVSFSKNMFKAKAMEKAKRSVVTVHASTSLKAYGSIITKKEGTGCIVDKTQGLILTNRHVVDPMAINTYNITFYNGEQADAKLCYYDPWLDYAFLKVLPEAIPDDTATMAFNVTAPAMNQPVFIIGNNEGKGFSVHTGNVSGIQEVIGSMPQHSINVSMNTKGGSSGSPIVDNQGKAVALNYAGDETFGIGLHPAYIQYALSFIKQGKIPVRKHMGAIAATYSLNDGVKYRNFPKAKIKTYVKQFPTALSNAIQVVRVLQGTPAEGKLLAGDILWAVDGQVIGPNLVTLDMAMNNAHASQVRLTICRNGEWLDIDIPLYNLEDHKVTRMVSFGGTLFFETDDIFSEKVGLPAGTLTFSNALGSSTFAQVMHFKDDGGSMHFGLKLLTLDNVPVDSLDVLVQHIPRLIDKKYFTIDYVNLMPLDDDLSELFRMRFSQRDTYKSDVAYDSSSPEPRLFVFDRKKMEWSAKRILEF